MIEQESLLISIDDFVSQGSCPYFQQRKSVAYAFTSNSITPAVYEILISSGFRRNGFYFYQNLCPNCSDCIPIRVNTLEFKPSRSQRRTLKKNSDITLIRTPVKFDPEGFALYQKYCAARHYSIEMPDDYIRFLIESPLQTEMMRYYAGSTLIGIGWIDILIDSISSVYFIFDPDYSQRSLGVFSVLKEVELCRELNKTWLQLGFWIQHHRKMCYKSHYKPYHLLINGVWEKREE